MTTTIRILTLFLIGLVLGCKKDATFTEEVSARDFYVRFDLIDPLGNSQTYSYQGEQAYGATGSNAFKYGYGGSNDLYGGYKYLVSQIEDALGNPVFRLAIQQEPLGTSQNPDTLWTKADIESFFTVGRRITYGNGSGQASIFFENHPEANIILQSTEATNIDGILEVQSIEDYGSPEAGIPYAAKIIVFKFSGSVMRSDSSSTPGIAKIVNGQAALFFPYP
jgi:hypothetical protein